MQKVTNKKNNTFKNNILEISACFLLGSYDCNRAFSHLDFLQRMQKGLPVTFEYSPDNLKEIEAILAKHGVREALIKSLSRNHNDKNQIYSGSEFRPLFPMFDMDFNMRGPSQSQKKGGRTKGNAIPEAVFKDFHWLDASDREVEARNVKMIIYAQYPETRLSGFQTVENTMPLAMSVEFTKQHPDTPRFLILGRRGGGGVLAIMVVEPGSKFKDDVAALPSAVGSRVWKHLRLHEGAEGRLIALLSKAAKEPLFGCRLDSGGQTLPFNGTQVCGYTLEHALGIIPNSDKNGDFEGIELKTHTQKKVTLFTPEPDMGSYAADFGNFMRSYGYKDANGDYRITGIHRVDLRCEKSNLTLRVVNHERGTSLAASADKNVHLGLVDDQGRLAAGWSLERLLNNWNSKHNEAVYVPAVKKLGSDPELVAQGYKYTIEFSDRVMWCRETSAEQLFEALYNGTLFLDPAPKLCPGNPKLNKRRSQWRVNDIGKAAKDLYNDVRIISLENELGR